VNLARAVAARFFSSPKAFFIAPEDKPA